MTTRLIVGFIAAALSVLVFQMITIAIIQAAGGAVPAEPWSLEPVPPFGVPRSLNLAFWGGLWGLLYALLEPWLTARFGWLLGGLVFGALPVLALWFVVFPLKGIPVGGGWTGYGIFLGILLHAVFGIGTAILYRLLRSRIGHGRTPAAGAA
jgi:hypothetical protein